jgi:deoxyribose-phosphate aldolase
VATAADPLASAIEHTLLSQSATRADVARLCDEAREHRFHGVCVNPLFVSEASARLQGSPVAVVTVVAFPLGAAVPELAAREAERAVRDGASELDLVIPIGLALAGDYASVRCSVAAVRSAAPTATLKVIIETGHFAPEQLAQLVPELLASGADFLKTSTGFGPRGATLEDVRLLRRLAAGRAEVKAAGGIRTADAARAMLRAGASRIGTSRGVAIVTGAEG